MTPAEHEAGQSLSGSVVDAITGELFYRALYEHEGGDWRAVEPRYVWENAAERLRAMVAAAPGFSSGGGPDEGRSAAEVDGASSRDEPIENLQIPPTDRERREAVARIIQPAAPQVLDAMLAKAKPEHRATIIANWFGPDVLAQADAIDALYAALPPSAPPQQGEETWLQERIASAEQQLNEMPAHTRDLLRRGSEAYAPSSPRSLRGEG